MQAYCPDCQATKEMDNPKIVKMKNGMSTVEGNCPKCKIIVYRIHRTWSLTWNCYSQSDWLLKGTISI
jgi:hypothetical protein